MTSSPYLSGQDPYGSGSDQDPQAGASQDSYPQSSSAGQPSPDEVAAQAPQGEVPQEVYPQGDAAQEAYLQGDAVQEAYPQGAGAEQGQAYQGQAYQQAYQGQAYQQAYQGQAYQDPYQGQAYQQAYQGQPYQGAYVQPGPTSKSKVAAGLLGILLGTLGVHNFYLGHTGRGVAQLLISVLSFGFLAWVSWIWGIVEGILILTAQPGQYPWGVDANGVPLQN